MPTFSEIFRAYLSAGQGDVNESQLRANLLMFERKPGQWVGGMRQELEKFSDGLLSASLRTGGSDIPRKVRDRIEHKWISLAMVLRNPWRFVSPQSPAGRMLEHLLAPRVEESRRLLLGLYSFVRGVEKKSNKWWHKGNLCWFLADSHLEANDAASAWTYFLLALIEDAWCFERSRRARPAQNPGVLPAFLGLKTIAPNQADQLLARCSAVISHRKHWSPLEPELSYLSTVCKLEYFATLRGPLPFSNNTAQAFLSAADRASTNSAKGEAYESLLAYLFESTEGFQAVLNAIGRDQENDLLVVNRRPDLPLRCLGEFLICQCKNTQRTAGAALIREFAGRLLEAGCESGLFLCKKGISGNRAEPMFPQDAASTRIKARQREGMSILTLERADLVAICAGAPRFDVYLSDEYVRVRFDLLRIDETKHGRRKTSVVKKTKRARKGAARKAK